MSKHFSKVKDGKANPLTGMYSELQLRPERIFIKYGISLTAGILNQDLPKV